MIMMILFARFIRFSLIQPTSWLHSPHIPTFQPQMGLCMNIVDSSLPGYNNTDSILRKWPFPPRTSQELPWSDLIALLEIGWLEFHRASAIMFTQGFCQRRSYLFIFFQEYDSHYPNPDLDYDRKGSGCWATPAITTSPLAKCRLLVSRMRRSRVGFCWAGWGHRGYHLLVKVSCTLLSDLCGRKHWPRFINVVGKLIPDHTFAQSARINFPWVSNLHHRTSIWYINSWSACGW